MNKNIFYFLLINFMVLSLSCEKGDKVEINNKISEIKAESEKLNNYFEDRFKDYVDRNPMFQTRLGIKKDYDKLDDISPEREKFEFQEAKKSLKWLSDSIKIGLLDKTTRLSYDLYRQRLENQINDFKYRLYNYPINQMFGMQSRVPAFMINMHKVSTKKDAEAYISRLNQIKPLFQQLEENLKERKEAGIVPPGFVFDHVLDDSRNVITGYPFEGRDSCALFKDIYFKIHKLDLSESEKNILVDQAKGAILESVQSAYISLIGLLRDIASKTNEKDGVWRWKNGDAFYYNALKRTTTTDMTAEQIHQLGLSEVDRIHMEMKKIKDQVGFNGSLQDFFKELKENDRFYYPDTEEGRQAYLEEAVNIVEKFKLRLDELFITKPKADMIVKRVEKFREKSAGKAFYQRPAPDGSRPGTYYANLYSMRMMPIYQMEALAFHEGIPGHHMQLAIAQELKDIPKFRKFSGYTAYSEGWGLYSEYLPKELGFYSDPYSDFGRLAMELWRSCRLVVDTGIHSKKWTRQEGIDYYSENTPNDLLDCVKMVERHIVMPSQATAYKIGMNKILELRRKAENKLGDEFDIRKFHETILTNGAVPLDILERHIGEMINHTLSD
tara:strand:- start:1734 stop:3566 length:1833 start_codon:yes stop_codon:yes gene_type:complete